MSHEAGRHATPRCANYDRDDGVARAVFCVSKAHDSCHEVVITSVKTEASSTLSRYVTLR